MADEEVRTVLTAEDNTGPAFASAIKNQAGMEAAASSVERSMSRAASRSGLSLDAYKAKMQAAKAATQQHTQEVQKQEQAVHKSSQAHEKHAGVIARARHELGHMAAEFTSVVAAIEIAREGFMKFGEQDRALGRIQVQTHATRKEVEAILPSLRILSDQFKAPLDDMIEGFTELRERAHLTIPQAQGLMPSLAAGALALETSVKDLSTVYGDLMQKFKLTPEDAPKVMDMMALAQQHMLLNAGEMERSIPRLSSMMRGLGFSGVEGVQKMLSYLAILRPSYGSAAEAAQGLDRILMTMNNEQVALRNGMTQRGMMLTLDRARKEGKDVLAMYLAMLKSAMDRGMVLGDLSQREQLAVSALLDGLGHGNHAYQELSHSIGSVSNATTLFQKDTKATISDLKNGFEELTTSVGEFVAALDKGIANALGAKNTTALRMLTHDFRMLGEVVRGDWKAIGERMSSQIEVEKKTMGIAGPKMTAAQRADALRAMRERDAAEDMSTPIPNRPLPGPRSPIAPPVDLQPGPGGIFQRMSYDPERELRNQQGALRDIAELLRQIRDGKGPGGMPAVQNASYSPSGGGSSGFSPNGMGASPGGGGFSLPNALGGGAGGGLPGFGGTGGGGRFNGLGGHRTPGGMDVPPPAGGGGGGGMPSGGGRPARGALGRNQQEAYAAARANGLSDSAARILVANMSGESLANPRDHHWDVKHMSQGIVQWDPQRAERIKREFGKYPKDMSVAEQTEASLWEMKKFYPKQYRDLTNEGMSAQDRMTSVVGGYERPANVRGAVAGRMGHLGRFQPNVPQQAATPAPDAGTQGALNQQPDYPPQIHGLEDAQQIRAKLEEPITLQTRIDAGASQWHRTSMQREASKEMRESRWNSYADIGAA